MWCELAGATHHIIKVALPNLVVYIGVMNTPQDLNNIEALAKQIAETETTTSALKHKRDTAIREAINNGHSMYSIAKVAGISQQAVAKIRDAE